MKLRLDDFVTLLLYGLDVITVPRLRNLDETYEGWLHQKGLLDRFYYLERGRYLDRVRDKADWVYHLTEKARLQVHGGRDPEKAWNRPWDGLWRQVVFDLPVDRSRERRSLLRWLRQNGFGYLQNSVWIRPDPVSELSENLKEFHGAADTIVILESRCAVSFSNGSIVSAAWAFDEINAAYQDYIDFVSRWSTKQRLSSAEVVAWMRKERELWLAAFHADPLLPLSLWPPKYKGEKAWRLRQEILRRMVRR